MLLPSFFQKYKKYSDFAKSLINPITSAKNDVWNFRVIKSSYEIELRKIKSHFESLTRTFLQKFFFRVTNSTS